MAYYRNRSRFLDALDWALYAVLFAVEFGGLLVLWAAIVFGPFILLYLAAES
jgi:hypothetical protein